MFPLSITNWIYVGLAAVILGLGITVKVQTSRLEAVKTEYENFRVETKAMGVLAKDRADAEDKKNKLNKDKVDAQNKVLKADNATLTKRLRDSRASSSYVPSAPAGSPSPDTATVNRAELNGAIQRLDAGVQGLIDEGNQAVIDLNTAKQWAQE